MNHNLEKRTDHLGNVFKSKKEMCEKYGITRSTFDQRYKRGLSIEEILLIPPKQNACCIEDRTDHLGNIFETKDEMCKYWKINCGAYNRRKSKGWSKEKILTTEQKRRYKWIDHKGNIFNTRSEMLKFWGVSGTTYEIKIKLGYSLEDILTKRFVIDHLGNKFNSKKRNV